LDAGGGDDVAANCMAAARPKRFATKASEREAAVAEAFNERVQTERRKRNNVLALL